MAQRKLHEKIETYIVVTIISVLVWLYAEATVLKQETGKSVQLLLDEPTNSYALTPSASAVRVSYRGSSGQIQQFNEMTALPLVHEIDPTGITETVTRTIVLDEALVRAGLGEVGITELEVEPATLSVTLEPLVSIDLPVVVQTQNLDLNGEPAAEPAAVSVTAPLDTVEQLRGQSVVATLVGADAGEGTGLERVAPSVALTYPSNLDLNSPWVTAEVRAVRINYTLANNIETVVVGRVPLYINLPVDVQLRYTVRPQDQSNFLRDVQLQGPADVIARIRANDPGLVVRAELSITDLSKIEQTSLERPVIIAPPGVTPVQLPEVMPITVRRRDTAAAPGS
ncbi:MAG: hypothetical protein AAF086_04085 [Planctomycetota bacterium]